jgi:hypothetical protein
METIMLYEPFKYGRTFNPRPEVADRRTASGVKEPSPIENIVDTISDIEHAKNDLACMRSIGIDTTLHEVNLNIAAKQLAFLSAMLIAKQSAPITYHYR